MMGKRSSDHLCTVFREWSTTKFEASPHMSSYLFTFAVSDFPFIETSYKDIKVFYKKT